MHSARTRENHAGRGSARRKNTGNTFLEKPKNIVSKK